MTDGRESPAAPAPAKPAFGSITPAEKVMLGVLIAIVGGLFVAMVAFHGSIVEVQRQIGDLRVEIHQEIGALEERMGRRMERLDERMGRRMDRLDERMGGLDERMARLEAIMEVHFGTPPLPADGAGDSAPVQ